MKHSHRKFQKIGNLIKPLVRANMKREYQSQRDIFSQWSNLVGEEISKKSIPSKLKINKFGTGNVLFIELLGHFGPEMSLQVQDIKEKINLYYGSEFVSKVVFTSASHKNFRRINDLDKQEKKTIENQIRPSPEISISDLELNSALVTFKENLRKRKKQK